jgi:DNA-binding transcriptional LysR family regulator
MDLRRYDLNLLVTLEALLDEGSVTRAAGRLNLSQSAVSAALERLRDVFADPLLVRTGNRMEATPFARQLQGPLKTALASVSLALARPQRFDPAKARLHVRLALSDYAGLLILPRLYRAIAVEAPGISLEVVPKPAEVVLSRLVAGDVDLATAVDPPEGRDLFNAPLVDEAFVCVMRAGHPLARGRLTVTRLLDHAHVVVTAHGASAALVDRALSARGLRRRTPVSVPLFASAFALLAESDLVAILPERLSRGEAARFGLVLRKPPLAVPPYTLSIVWHRRTAHDPTHRWLRDRLLSLAGPPAGHRRSR